MTDGWSHPRRGAALLAVLLFTALASSLVVTMVRASTTGASAAALFRDEMQASEIGRTAALLVAHQMRSEVRDARRGGSFSARLGSSEIAIDYISEMSRVDVNQAPLGLLSALLTAAGAERDIVAAIVGRVERLRATALGQTVPVPSSGQDVSTSGGNAVPALVRTEQIIDAWDMPEALYHRIQNSLTASSRSSKVDPVLADLLVVTALMDGDEDRARQFIDERDRGFASASAALAQFPSRMRAFAGFGATQSVRAVARISVGRRLMHRYEFVMTAPDGAEADPEILSWRQLYSSRDGQVYHA